VLHQIPDVVFHRLDADPHYLAYLGVAQPVCHQFPYLNYPGGELVKAGLLIPAGPAVFGRAKVGVFLACHQPVTILGLAVGLPWVTIFWGP
jgi:hypothetical protein